MFGESSEIEFSTTELTLGTFYEARPMVDPVRSRSRNREPHTSQDSFYVWISNMTSILRYD